VGETKSQWQAKQRIELPQVAEGSTGAVDQADQLVFERAAEAAHVAERDDEDSGQRGPEQEPALRQGALQQAR
jgi:hypothetical protein